MKDSEQLQIGTVNTFEELPDRISFSPGIANISDITLPQALFNPETPLSEAGPLDQCIPIIVRPVNDTLTIVDGCKRYLWQKQNKQSKISCNIIKTELDDFAAGLLRIALNKERSQTLQEKILFLSWLKKNSPEETFESYTRKAGFSPRDIRFMTPVLSCDNHIKDALFKGLIDISLLTYFQVLTPEDQQCFIKVFEGMKLSLQTQREFLEWLPEIACNENKTVSGILSEEQITDILEDTKLNDPQRIQKIHSLLNERRFPRLSEARTIWKKQAAALNPDPACVTFVSHPCFERNHLEIKISVTDSQSTATILKELANVSPDEWKTLIYPLFDRKK